MTKPKYLYEIEARDFVAYSDGPGTITLVQQHPLDGSRDDLRVYLNRANAEGAIRALTEWLAATTPAQMETS